MNEHEYIVATNLAKLRIVREILASLIDDTHGVPGVPHDEWMRVRTLVNAWELDQADRSRSRRTRGGRG